MSGGTTAQESRAGRNEYSIAVALRFRDHTWMNWRVRRIGPDEGDRLRDIRLRALRDAPGAFAASFESESARPPAAWDEAAGAWSAGVGAATFVAEAGREWVGLIGARRGPECADI